MDEDGDRDNFSAMFDRCGPAVYRYAYRRVGPDAADDVVEDTFLAAWRRRGELPADPLPWLLRTAGNVISNQRRSRFRVDRLAARSAAQPAAAAHDPAESVVQRRGLAEALGALSEGDREVLMLGGLGGAGPEAGGGGGGVFGGGVPGPVASGPASSSSSAASGVAPGRA